MDEKLDIVDRDTAKARLSALLSSTNMPNPVTKAWLAEAYTHGLLSVDQLEDGSYYYGECRNADVARWDAGRKCFWYMRSKFGTRFAESIRHPLHDDLFDIFRAVAKVEPLPDEVVPTKETEFASYYGECKEIK